MPRACAASVQRAEQQVQLEALNVVENDAGDFRFPPASAPTRRRWFRGTNSPFTHGEMKFNWAAMRSRSRAPSFL